MSDEQATVRAAMARLGGIASRRELLEGVTRGALERAVRSGTVRRAGWGRYALPTDLEGKRAAQEAHGTAILVSAAAHWDWRRKWEPRKPQLAVKRGRHVSARLRSDFDIRWRAIADDEIVDGWVTSRLRTVMDCAVLLPFDEALAITDSALRSGTVETAQLLARLTRLDPQLHPRVEKVVRAADAYAANPFESVLRAICLDIDGLDLRCQVRIDDRDGWVGRVDLADRRLRIVIEGESFEFHGEKEMLDRDCARYSRLTADGWLVLRFSWTQVMAKPDWVRDLVRRTVAHRQHHMALACLPFGDTPSH
jgi:very-short-patch-repair endonuclease